MLTVPLYIFLFIYLLFLCVFTILSLINLYHIVSTGTFTFVSFIMTFFTFVATVLTLYFTWHLLSGIDWQQPLTLFDGSWFQ